ncbi:MAG: proprotein convertase P-domain-containing protein [Flavobacteriaceae bacterium]|nr:proprotein convertase P-domain-containing protein [Flavobacteriaceae bacterium]
MKAKLHYVFSLAIFLITFSISAQNKYFNRINGDDAALKNAKSIPDKVRNKKVFEFNYLDLSKALSKASDKNSASSKSTSLVISFPNLSGEFENYQVFEASVMHPDLQAKYPEIRSYVGYGIDSPTSYLRLSLSPYKGLSGIILGQHETILFEPNAKKTNQIAVISKSDFEKTSDYKCETLSLNLKNTLKALDLKNADDSQKRTYRLALSTTGEYSVFHGGTKPLVNAALVSTLTTINAVYENDFNVSLQLIANNDDVIYLNPASDPYTTLSNYNTQLANTLDTVILEANYDVGHLLGGINDSSNNPTGNAGCIGCVCNNGGSVGLGNHKGSGFTTSITPDGFNFYIDYVAHEMGHQFGGNHTWTHDGDEGENVQIEPGSGSTIMGYAGITGSTNVQPHSDAYFHAISIDQITTFVKSTSCAIVTNTGNTTPIANAGSDLTLPIGTAFKLVGSGSDVDGDTVTFCWEQINEDNAVTTYPNPNLSSSNSVLFRSYSPTTNNTRFFPNLSDLKFGVNSTQWEKVPNTNRTADFRLTVRDNKPGGANNSHDDMKVTFSTSYGPFEVTSQNTPDILWTSGTNETITWNVNNTNALIGASNVNILLSTDGGLTYNAIVNNIPNNGSYTLTVPNMPAPHCRLMIAPTNHNFFAINSEDFAIDYSINTTCTQYNSASSLGITITDNGGSFTQTHSINIPDNATISDVNFGVDITHTYIGDLAIAILSPSNTEVLLKSSNDCGSEADMIGSFDNEAIAYNCSNSGSNIASNSLRDLLSSFYGENSSGNWTIKLGDFASGDIGTLNSWFVEICETIETPLNTSEFDFTNFKVFPNPNKGEFNIKLLSKSSKINMAVYDLRGRVIYKNNYTNSGHFNEKINLNHIQSGVYILMVSDGLRKSTKKLVVE